MAWVRVFFLLVFGLVPTLAWAGTAIPLSVQMSEAVVVTGSPQIAVTVGSTTRYAVYTTGSGTSTLTFTLQPQAGDLDLDGIAVSSPVLLNGGTIKDVSGNDAVLTFTPPTTTGIKVNYPSLSMDFVADADGRYSVNGAVYDDLPAFLSATGGSYARSTTATYFDSTGTLQTAAANSPRFDYDPSTLTPRGILLEGARTNTLRNATGAGAVVGSPGTMPTNWSKQNTVGVSFDVAGTGTENGLSYIDFHAYGTPSGTGAVAVFFENSGVVAAADTQTWAGSVYVKLVGGSLTNITGGNVSETIQFFSAALGYLGGLATAPITPTGAALASQRAGNFGTIANASTAWVRSGVYFNVSTGLPIDITLRLAAPQLENAAGVTSYIPTTGAAASRGADSLTLPLGSWFSATQGTLWATTVHGSRTSGGILSIDNSASAATDRISLVRTSSSAVEAMVRDSSAIAFQTSVNSTGNYTSNKMGMAYAANSFREALNGTFGTLDTSGVLPTVNRFLIGAYSTSPYDAWISKVKYYPVRIADATLQQLTQ